MYIGMLDINKPNEKEQSHIYIVKDLKSLKSKVAEYSNLLIEESEFTELKGKEEVVSLSVMETTDNAVAKSGWIVLERYFKGNADMVRDFLNS
ncbi:hypothetical protein ACN2A0_02440 [Aerococcus viridans]